MDLEDKLLLLKKWWFEKIVLIKTFYKNKNKKIKLSFNMGDIYFAKMGVNIGAEIDKNRPVLIFQGIDYFLDQSDMIFVFPITSNRKNRKYSISFSEIDLINKKLKIGSILLQQGRFISKLRLVHKIDKLKEPKLKEIKIKFEKLLYKNTPLKS
jgi:mRNA-degrading endonuclease toxin of MazEF toxin-antitoxin module